MDGEGALASQGHLEAADNGRALAGSFRGISSEWDKGDA